MKKKISMFAKLCLVFVMMFGVVGCGKEEKVSPLSSKEYEAMEYSAGESDLLFDFFMSDKLSEFSKIMFNFSDYIMKHEKELDGGKRFSDFDDYEAEMDAYYKWCYQVTNFDMANVPADYVRAWNRLKEIAIYSKDCMDKIYNCDSEERASIVQEMSVKVTNDLNSIVGLMPLAH